MHSNLLKSIARGLDWLEFAGWIALAVGLPLYVLPAGYDSYVLPKVLLAETLIACLLALAVVLTALGRPFRLALNPALGVWAAWAVWHAISIAWADSRSLAWDEARFWLWLALASLLFQSAFWGRLWRIRLLALAALAGAAATAAWTLEQDFRAAFFPESLNLVSKLEDWRGYLAAGFGNTGHIADFMALAYPLGFVFLFRARSRRAMALAIGLLWLSYAALIVCFSVHSNAGLIAAMALTLAALWRRWGWRGYRRRMGRIAALAGGWLAIALFFSLNAPGNPHRPGIFRQAFASERLFFGGESRLAIWKITLEMIRDNRWLGVGAGNYEYVFPTVRSAWVENDPAESWMIGVWTNAAHNELLQSWAELGVPGLVFPLALFALLFRAFGAWRGGRGFEAHGRIACAAALAAYAVHAQMNFPLQMPVAAVWLALLVGMSETLARPKIEFAYPDVCFAYGWGRAALELATFTRPRAVRIEPAGSWRIALLAACLIGAPAVCFPMRAAWLKQRSDIAYRAASEARRIGERRFAHAGATAAAADFALAAVRFEEALRLWPEHHNCRSEYAEFLVKLGRADEALSHLELVRKRLTAWEIELRRARALWLLGRDGEALEAAGRAFAIQPARIMAYPAIGAWIQGMPVSREALSAEMEAGVLAPGGD